MAEAQVVGAPALRACPACGFQVPGAALACPSCHALLHADELKALAAAADAAATAGDADAAIVGYRSVLELLPRASRQHARIAAKIEALTSGPRSPPLAATDSRRWGKLAGLGGVALLLWKLKGILLLGLGKGKLLLLGLTKASTVLSMLASLGVYWALWGWQLAAGLIASMYVHEMGHVAALRRLGIAATAPMFIPGLGAMVRLKQYPATAREDAHVGLAGPVWGLGAALVALLIGWGAEAPLGLAIARLGAWLNLFNLIPFGSLDGGRGFRALSRRGRTIVAAGVGIVWLLTGESLLLLVLVAAGARAAIGVSPATSDRATIVWYLLLIGCLGALATVQVPVP